MSIVPPETDSPTTGFAAGPAEPLESAGPSGLPSTVEAKLRTIRLRHVAVAGLRAAAAAAAVLGGLMLVFMAVDWSDPFADSWIRVTGLVLTLAAAAATGIGLAVGPVRRALRVASAARAADRGVPQLEERWATVASLAEPKGHYEPYGSFQTRIDRAMADQVRREAAAMEKVVRPGQVPAADSPRRALLALGGVVALLAGLMIASPVQGAVLIGRFWSPLSGQTATQVRTLSGDQLVKRGETVDLVAATSGLTRPTAELVLRTGSVGVGEAVETATGSDDRFTFTVPVEETFDYRIVCGDGRTGWHTVTAIDPPEVAAVAVDVIFPKYMNREPVTRDQLPRRLEVPAGSRLLLAIEPVRSVASLDVSLTPAGEDGSAQPVTRALRADGDGRYRVAIQAEQDMIVEATLTSPEGLTNDRRLFSRVRVVADRAPVARIVEAADETVAIDETLEIEFEAHDDHGVAAVEVIVYDESQTDADGRPRVVRTQSVPLGEQAMQRQVRGTARVDLAALMLPVGSEISYAIRAVDNRDAAE